MTNLDRPIKRETAALERGRPLVVDLHAKYVSVWPKGTRDAVAVSWDAIFDLGRKNRVRQLDEMPKARRKGARAR